jgi:hypothetical protein
MLDCDLDVSWMTAVGSKKAAMILLVFQEREWKEAGWEESISTLAALWDELDKRLRRGIY